MTIALVAHTFGISSNGGTSATTSAINTTGANFIAVSLSDAGTATDNMGNTYTYLTTHTGSAPSFRLAYCENPTVGSGHTFTTTGSFPCICVAVFSGVATGSFDQQTGSATGSPGAITPSFNNELLVTGCGLNSATAATINGGFTITDNAPYTPGQNYGGALAYLIQTTATVANPTWATGAVANSAMASFKASATVTPTNNAIIFGMNF